MKIALRQARKAYEKDEVPIGAVVVREGRVIARAYNQKEEKMTSLRHAEITAIEKACRKLNNWRLNGCTMYVTLEPCMMCTGAILESRLERVVYGAENIRMGFLRFLRENHPERLGKLQVNAGVMAEESANLIREFFRGEVAELG